MNGKWISCFSKKCLFLQSVQTFETNDSMSLPLADIYPAFVEIVDLLFVSYEKNCSDLLY